MTDAAPSRGLHYWARQAWRPGGRWERILAVLYRGDLPSGQIRFATQTGEHTARAERKKVGRALDDMVRVGLIQRTEAGPYTITALGSRTLIEGRIPPVEAAPSRTRATPTPEHEGATA